MVVKSSRNNSVGIGDNKYCSQCHRLLPVGSESNICESCQDLNLFKEVRDFIRANNVSERDVAEYFDLPLTKVREWIKEGKIQYS